MQQVRETEGGPESGAQNWVSFTVKQPKKRDDGMVLTCAACPEINFHFSGMKLEDGESVKFCVRKRFESLTAAPRCLYLPSQEISTG